MYIVFTILFARAIFNYLNLFQSLVVIEAEICGRGETLLRSKLDPVGAADYTNVMLSYINSGGLS